MNCQIKVTTEPSRFTSTNCKRVSQRMRSFSFIPVRHLSLFTVSIGRWLSESKTKNDKKETMSTTNGCISIFSDLLALLDCWNARWLSSSDPNVCFSRIELGWTLIGTIMRRSTIANSNNEPHPYPSLSTTTSTDLNNQQQKRSLEDYGFSANLKRRRHLSPQNANIDLNCESDPMSSPALRKKTRAKSKNQSIMNSSTLDTSLETSSIVDNQTPRVSSVPRLSPSVSDCIPDKGMLLLQFTFDWWSSLTPDNSHMTHCRADVFWKER